jgi:hypothetical protein
MLKLKIERSALGVALHLHDAAIAGALLGAV